MTDCAIDDGVFHNPQSSFRGRPKSAQRPGMTLCLGQRIDDTARLDDISAIDDVILVDGVSWFVHVNRHW